MLEDDGGEALNFLIHTLKGGNVRVTYADFAVALHNAAKAWNGKGFYSMLTVAGYDSYQVGKMHYVWDSYGQLGFAHRKTQEEMSNPGDDYTNFIMSSPYRNVFDYNGHRSEMYYVPQISQLPAEYHPTAWVGDRSVEYIERCDPSKPVFLMSSFLSAVSS